VRLCCGYIEGGQGERKGESYERWERGVVCPLDEVGQLCLIKVFVSRRG
jgi:hypothetical protein